MSNPDSLRARLDKLSSDKRALFEQRLRRLTDGLRDLVSDTIARRGSALPVPLLIPSAGSGFSTS
jgi:hypothetical protein